MRILWHSVSPLATTAYGNCTRELTRRIRDLGHFVRIGTKHGDHKWYEHDGFEIFDGVDTVLVNQMIAEDNFDYIFTMWDIWILQGKRQYPKEKWVASIPVDTEWISDSLREVVPNVGMPIAMSQHGKRELGAAGLKDVRYAPLGFDDKVFKPLPAARAAFRKELGLTDENFVIGSVGLNYGDDRKGFINLLLAFKDFHANHPEARLFLHTAANEREILAESINYHKIIAYLGLGEVVIFPNQMALIQNRIDAGWLAEIYNGFDVMCLACFSEDTHLWTKDGLRPVNQLKQGEEVFTANAAGMLELQKIKRVYCYNYRGDMVHFGNKQLDMLVTPNHRIYYSTPKTRSKYQVRQASEFLESKTRYYIPLTARWTGRDDDTIDLRQLVGNKKYHPNSSNFVWKVKTTDFMELLGWFISEGCVTTKQGKAYTVIANNNQASMLRVKQILESMGLHPFDDCQNGCHKILVYSKQLCDVFKQCGKYARNKTIPAWCLEYSPDKLIHLFNSLMAGDGSVRGHHKTFYTSSEKLTERFVELCLKLGYSIKFNKRVMPDRFISEKGGKRFIKSNDGWVVAIKTKKTAGTLTGGHITKQPYSGDVWCVETENGNVFSERNGLICLSGNSKGEGFGMPLVEAQACGIPVIVTNSTSGPELCKTGWLIDVDSDDRHWLSTGVLRLEPRPSNIVKALEQAHAGRGVRSWGDVKARAAESVLEYTWDAVWKNYWLPIFEEMERRLLK